MRNLKHYDGDSFAFFETVVSKVKSRSDDPNYKNRIEKRKTDIKKLFLDFDKSFNKNSLEKLHEHEYNKTVIKDLNKLYSYRSKIFQKLKNEVTTTSTGRSVGICQCCTLGEVNSFDHTLPKKKFAGYSVHPKNLFPSCSRCNGHKNDSTSTTKSFLNLYLDKLPNKQYLFAKIKLTTDNVIRVEFYLDNPNNIEKKFFLLIKSHYEKLHLCNRFKDNVDDVISDLVDDVESNLEKLSLDDAVYVTRIKIKKEKKAFGFNFWPAILKEELLNHKKFMDRFSKPKQ